MSASVIDGKKIAQEIQEEVREQVTHLNTRPGLAVLLVGNNPASELYVSLKQKAARKAGIDVHLYRFEENAPEEEVLKALDWLNKDSEVHAILVQLPLPEHLKTETIIRAIDPKKDVDGFHPENVKGILENKNRLTPGLSLGILQLILACGIELPGKKIAIVGKSPAFTAVLKHVLEAYETQVSIVAPDEDAHRTTREADVLVVAAGKPRWITDRDIKENAIIIDVGTNTLSDGETIGDVDFESCAHKASWITPVPGGVGPMTVAMLLKNTILLAQEQSHTV